jgi:TrmH family RNA methyltransferase
MLAGRRLVAEFLAERPESVELVVLAAESGRGGSEDAAGASIASHPDLQPGEATFGKLKIPAGLATARFAPELFRELDFLGAGSPLLVVRVPEIPAWSPEATGLRGLTVVLPLSDPENLGAALRSCAAFGVDRIVLLAEAAHPFHPRALRSSAGQAWRTPLFRGPSLSRLLADRRASQVPLFALDLHGEDLSALPVVNDLMLLVGEEGPGVPKDLDCRRLRIPMRSEVESLNAGVALGIALYHFRRI